MSKKKNKKVRIDLPMLYSSPEVEMNLVHNQINFAGSETFNEGLLRTKSRQFHNSKIAKEIKRFKKAYISLKNVVEKENQIMARKNQGKNE